MYYTKKLRMLILLLWVRSWAPYSLDIFLFVLEQIFASGKLSFWFCHMLFTLAKQKCQISGETYFHLFFFGEAFPQYNYHCSDNEKDTFTHWNSSSWEEHYADGLQFGLFVPADHYLLCWLLMPCVCAGVSPDRAAVVSSACTVWPFTVGQCGHSAGHRAALVCGCCSGGHTGYAQSPSHLTAWDVFSSAVTLTVLLLVLRYQNRELLTRENRAEGDAGWPQDMTSIGL